MNRKARKYIYSNKKHTEKGIFATILAVISFIALISLMILSYVNKGDVKGSCGAVAFLCTLFSAAGIILGTMGKHEPEKFYLFAYMGIIWNVVDLFLVSAILYAGI